MPTGSRSSSVIDQRPASADQHCPTAARAAPGADPRAWTTPLDDAERRLSGALMRVNHVGEVCAPGLLQRPGAHDTPERRAAPISSRRRPPRRPIISRGRRDAPAMSSAHGRACSIPSGTAAPSCHRPGRGPARRRGRASASWSRPSARSRATSTAISSAAGRVISRRAPSSAADEATTKAAHALAAEKRRARHAVRLAGTRRDARGGEGDDDDRSFRLSVRCRAMVIPALTTPRRSRSW